MKNKHLLLLTSLSFLCTVVTSAEVYKWKDSSGQIHYTQHPGPNGSKKDQLMKTIKGKNKKDDIDVTDLSLPRGDMEDVNQEIEQLQTESYKEKLKKFCAKQKKNLKTLESSKPVAWEEEGETHLLNKQERKEKVEDIKDSLADNCAD